MTIHFTRQDTGLSLWRRSIQTICIILKISATNRRRRREGEEEGEEGEGEGEKGEEEEEGEGEEGEEEEEGEGGGGEGKEGGGRGGGGEEEEEEDPSFNVSSETNSFLVARILDQICEGFRSLYGMSPGVLNLVLS